MNDRVIWAPSSLGKFSFRPFRRTIATAETVSVRWKLLWAMPVYMKVKCFVWLLLKDRLALRGRLYRLGLIQEEGNLCPLCWEVSEVGFHLFIHYSKIYRLWGRVARLWDLTFVGTRDVPSCFNVWCHAMPKGNRESIWKMTFLALK